MGAFSFAIYFIVALVGVIFLQDYVQNKFISAFVVALIIAVLGSRGD